MIIKQSAEDFVVEEVAEDGTVFEVEKSVEWRGGEGEHLVFLLEKRNWDTISAAKEICKRMGVSQKRIGYAGTKDRKAWTCQRMSLWDVKKEQLEALRIKDMVFRPLEYSQRRAELGDLRGNRFTLIIRGLKEEFHFPERIPNSFGEQRFGTYRPVTHEVGKAIVNEQYKRAVELYLWRWFDTEPEGDLAARKRLEAEQDFKAALSYFPTHLRHERALISHMAQHENDYVGALRSLPKKLLSMFVHAYQSHLFNRVLEKRAPLGLDALEGDILDDGVPTGPLFGYGMEIAKGLQGAMENEVLEEEWLQLNDFKCHGMPELSSSGMRRRLYITVDDLKMLEKGEDWVKVRFSLPKGCYATSALQSVIQ